MARTMDILVVEDNPRDAALVCHVFKSLAISCNLNVVKDGTEAMAYLLKEGQYTSAHEPDLLLLDLNLPKKDGREVLREVRQNFRLRILPIIIFTGSDRAEDILKSYELGANCFITKPFDLSELQRVVKNIEAFWLTTVQRPPRIVCK